MNFAKMTTPNPLISGLKGNKELAPLKPMRGLSLLRTYRLMCYQVNAGKVTKVALWAWLGGLSMLDLGLMYAESNRAAAQ